MSATAYIQDLFVGTLLTSTFVISLFDIALLCRM